MTAETDLTRLSPLIERLVDETDARARERLLVDAIADFEDAPSTALWHETEAGWHTTLERGSRAALPGASEVQIVALGQLGLLANGRHVLIAGRAPGRIALALGGVALEEDLIDMLEALLVTVAELEAAADGLLEKLLPPFQSPAGSEPPPDRRWTQDLRGLLTSIRTTQDLLGMPGADLSDDERQRFGEALELECQRAGDLLIEALEERRSGTNPGHARSGNAPAEIIREVCAAEEAVLRHAGLELALEVLPSAAHLNCPLSDLSLARVVHSLVCNAREALTRSFDGEPHAVTQPATISVTLSGRSSANGATLRLVIEDEGPGVPPAHLSQLFQHGFTAYKRGSGGNGLALVHDLVTGAGGHVAVENRSSGGTRFVVTFASPLGAR